jgi:hypothetical protein
MKHVYLILISLNFLSLTLLNAQWIDIGPPVNLYTWEILGSNADVIAATDHGIYYSTNLGQNWMLSTRLDICASLTKKGANYFSGSTQMGVYKSTDNGKSWEQTGLDSGSVIGLGSSSTHLFACVWTKGLFISSNDGVSWTHASLNRTSVRRLAASGSTVYVGADTGGVYVSFNNGQTWTQTALNGGPIYGLVINGSYTMAAQFCTGIFRSTNNGNTWAHTFAMDTWSFACRNSNVFAGLSDAGVFLSTDDGVTFYAQNAGIEQLTITALYMSQNYLFAGTNWASIWRRPLSQMIGVENISSNVPQNYELYQNYPNPFNPSTKIKFDVPSNVKSEKSNAKLVVYNILGKEIAVLVNEQLNAGTYEAVWNSNNFSTGVYFYTLQTDDIALTKKMMLIK